MDEMGRQLVYVYIYYMYIYLLACTYVYRLFVHMVTVLRMLRCPYADALSGCSMETVGFLNFGHAPFTATQIFAYL